MTAPDTPDTHDVQCDMPPTGDMPPAADVAPATTPEHLPPTPMPGPDAASAPTTADDTTRHDNDIDEGDTDDAPSGLPVGQVAAGGVSVAGIAGTVLYQTTGAVGLAAGGAVMAAGGIAYIRHRMGARKDGRRERMQTVKTVQTRTPATSGGGLLSRHGGGRGAFGRSGASRIPGLGGSGRQGGKTLWPRPSGPSAAPSSRPGKTAVSVPGKRGAASPSKTATPAKRGTTSASDGGGAALRPPTRRERQTATPAKGEQAKSGARKEPRQAPQNTTPTATKKKTEMDTTTTPTSRFSRWAQRWSEDAPGPISSRAARWSRVVDRKAHGKRGVWGWLLNRLFGWQHADTDDQHQTTDERTETSQSQPETTEGPATAEQSGQQPRQNATPTADATERTTAEQAAPQTSPDSTPQTAPDPAARHSRRPRATTHRRFPMSGSPLVTSSAEMAAAASGYAPEDMWVVARDLDTLGEMPINIANAVRVYTTRLEGEYPIHESVTELLRQLHDTIAASAAIADEIATQFRAVHSEDIKRDEAPRINERLWNV